jgi:hypothetical protein
VSEAHTIFVEGEDSEKDKANVKLPKINKITKLQKMGV